ncbi:MAG: gliding motility lipoprotein GldH [Chitinophagaceae bacterium]|nr:gliding motility lipoprotein GldH [Chitinophagaceae bacterium]
MFYKAGIVKKLRYLILPVFFFGCIQINLFEKQAPIKHQMWSHDYTPEFSFDIQDTTSLYNVFIVIRHTDLYGYNNLWLNIGRQAPGDTMRFEKYNFSLADADGWEGTGMNDIFEVRKLFATGTFRQAGTYKFAISQIMRDDPLKYIMSVGLRVERVE